MNLPAIIMIDPIATAGTEAAKRAVIEAYQVHGCRCILMLTPVQCIPSRVKSLTLEPEINLMAVYVLKQENLLKATEPGVYIADYHLLTRVGGFRPPWDGIIYDEVHDKTVMQHNNIARLVRPSTKIVYTFNAMETLL